MSEKKMQCPNCLKFPMDEVRYAVEYGLWLSLSPRIYACDACGCVTAKPKVYEPKRRKNNGC